MVNVTLPNGCTRIDHKGLGYEGWHFWNVCYLTTCKTTSLLSPCLDGRYFIIYCALMLEIILDMILFSINCVVYKILV